MDKTEEIARERIDRLEEKAMKRSIVDNTDDANDEFYADSDDVNSFDEQELESMPSEITNQHDVMMKALTMPNTERIANLNAEDLERVRQLKNIVSLCKLTKHPIAGAYIKRQARIIEGTSMAKDAKLLDNMITLKQEKKQNYPEAPNFEKKKQPSRGLKNLFSRSKKREVEE